MSLTHPSSMVWVGGYLAHAAELAARGWNLLQQQERVEVKAVRQDDLAMRA